jgi:ABC-type dipeptide/oligopeptide/nickel transport system permease component
MPQLLVVLTLAFIAINALPGSPARAIVGGAGVTQEVIDNINEQYGLNEPLTKQYGIYLWNLLQGDLGVSFTSQRPVAEEVFGVLDDTVLLTALALLIGWPLGVAIGSWAAKRPLSIRDRASTVLTTLAIATPTYFLALVLLFQIGFEVPAIGLGSAPPGNIVLPVATLSILVAGITARVARSSMLDVSRAEYVTAARARGLPAPLIWRRHVRRNSLMPLATLGGLTFGDLLGGAVFVEIVYLRPGIGSLMVTSIQRKDFPTVQGIVLVVALAYVVINVVVDLVYARLDPQYRDSLDKGS